MSSSVPPDPNVPIAEPLPSDPYLARVAAIVQRIRATTDPLDAVVLLTDVTRALDGEVSFFANFTREKPSAESYRILICCNPEWLSARAEVGRLSEDPWINYARLHSEPALASEIQLATPVETALADVAARFGFLSTVVAPALSNAERPRVGVLCLGSSVVGHFESCSDPLLKTAVRLVAQEFHEWWSAAMRQELIATARLSPDDITLLRLERAGVGTKEIERRLGLSGAAIDSRFQRLNARLGVPNRKAAALLAAECGLI